MFNVEKFTKVLGLTTSPADGEALNAIRIANKMLREANLSWTQIITTPPTLRPGERVVWTRQENPAPPNPHYTRGRSWAEDLSEQLRRRQEEWDRDLQNMRAAHSDPMSRKQKLEWCAQRSEHISNSEKVTIGAIFLMLSFGKVSAEDDEKLEKIFQKLKRKGL